ncbi:MAG: RNA polymerase sigma-70 factor [Ginsengibacter sp.]
MQIEKKYEESTLLSLLAQDSEYAFQVLFDQYRNNIYRVAMIYLKSPVIAEEIVQDVFLKLWFQRKHITEIRSLESWFFTLTKNLTLNCMKKITHEWMAREKWVKQNDLSENTTDFKVLNSECQQLFEKAIDHLSSQQQQVYRLAKEEGLSYDDISKKISISPLTVKTHMARALSSIRLFLQQNSDLSVLLIITGVICY